MAKRLVLVGGGHANLHVMDRLCRIRPEGYEILMISRDVRQYYSGMVAGFIEGVYEIDDCSFDLADLCRKNGILFVRDEVISIDKEKKELKTVSGKSFRYDLLSVDTGSEVRTLDVLGSSEFVLPIKPFDNLRSLKDQLSQKTGADFQTVVVGGGAAGVEIACAVAAFMEKCGCAPKITIIDAGSEILKGYPKKARLACIQALEDANVNVVLESPVVSLQNSSFQLESGLSIRFDLLIWATGTASQSMYRDAGLKVDARGFLLVDGFLRSISDHCILGAGDCVSLYGEESLPKNGVYAIREAPILAKNLLSLMGSGKMVEFSSSSRFLSILSIGKGHAVASYAGFSFRGRWVWKLKNLIDRSYMRRYRCGSDKPR
jgi:pyridine nucleotide-disulfide oxidoreductase family protein